MKKSSFSAREYLQQPPADEDIKEKDGSFHVPIGNLENLLDFFEWGTQNFHFEIYKDGYAKLCVAASLELVLSFEGQDGQRMTRCFVGACNFPIASIAPIPDFLGTAKSMCVKNAASDAGRKLGRGLNADIVPDRAVVAEIEKPKGKMKTDSKIREQFRLAVLAGDDATIALLANIYEITT